MVKGKPKIHFHILNRFSLNNKTTLKKFVLQLFENEGKIVNEINFIFCSDDYLIKINKEYLSHDFYTDIITFPLNTEQEAVKADIFISIERVKENANTLNLYFKDELHRVMIHGVLHLCGYGDKTKSQKKMMRLKEDEYLQTLKFHVKQKP
jgi:probable rRNA maturation factor